MQPQGDSREDRVQTAAALLLCTAREGRSQEDARTLLDILIRSMTDEEVEAANQEASRIGNLVDSLAVAT